MNMVAALSLLSTGADSGATTFGISLLIMLVGIPVSFTFWYRQIYMGVKQDSSISFFFFFLNYSFHIGASVLLCIGIPGWGGAGFIYLLDRFSKNQVGSGVLCIIATSLLAIEAILGLAYIAKAIAFYRSAGMSTEKAKKQAAVSVAKSDIGRDIAFQSVKSAANNR